MFHGICLTWDCQKVGGLVLGTGAKLSKVWLELSHGNGGLHSNVFINLMHLSSSRDFLSQVAQMFVAF